MSRAETSSGSALVVGKESRWIIPPLGERIDLVPYGPGVGFLIASWSRG